MPFDHKRWSTAASRSWWRPDMLGLSVSRLSARGRVACLCRQPAGQLRVQRRPPSRRPGEVFPLINDFQRWRAWSPYEKKAPAMRRTLSGAQRQGSRVRVGREQGRRPGRMEIVETAPPSSSRSSSTPQALRSPHIAGLTLVPRANHRGHVGGPRAQPLHVQGHVPRDRHGQDDRPGLRGGAGQSQGPQRSLPMSGGGLSKARLDRMREVMAGHVERGVPGLVTLISRRGETHVERSA